MAHEPQFAQEYLVKIEELVEAIVSCQQELNSLSGRRKKNKEAIDNLNTDNEIWTAFGNMFVSMPRPQLIASIKQGMYALN